MCGIAGKIFSDRERTVDENVIRRMTDVLAHRGPDASGVHIDGQVGLGHRRLSIIDLSEAARQPMRNEDGSVWIVQNGEIYNHLELRKDLESRGHIFHSDSDTETIVHLYEEMGHGCVTKLRGMFAFAIWDGRYNTLFLARDRFGQKPLVYAETSNGITFASEIKAVLQDEAVSDAIDDSALHDYLTYGYVPSPKTIYKHIRKLPPASTMIWKDGRSSVDRYWTLDYTSKLDISVDEAAEGVAEHLRDATRVRLMSDVPLGAFLSGGVDSSAIVAYMAESSSKPVKTFSIGFEDQSFDETPIARRVAKLFDTEHHEFIVTPSVLSVLPEIVWAYGEPYADSSALPTYYVSKITRQHVTVALNGDGGDETFAGYERYVAAALSNHYARLPGWLRKGVFTEIARRLPEPSSRKNILRRFKRFVMAQNLEPKRRYATWLTMMDNPTKQRLYSADFAERMNGYDSLNLFDETYASGAATDALDRILSSDVRTYLPDDLLVKVDIASMVHSLEARSPFLDHHLAEFVAKLPSNVKLRGRDRKFILKRALKNKLPDSILNRGKYGFAAPVARWFRGELKDIAGEVLLDPTTMSRGIWSRDGVQTMLAEHTSGRINHGDHIWELLMLELWFRTHVDRPRSALVGPAEGILPA